MNPGFQGQNKIKCVTFKRFKIPNKTMPNANNLKT